MPTYVKLQDAYIAEQGDSLGSWKTIGYTIAAMGSDGKSAESSIFKYNDGATADKMALSNGLPDAWKATTKAKLNDCTTTLGVWTLSIAQGGSQDQGLAKYSAKVADDATKQQCRILTQNFCSFSSDGKCSDSN